MIYILILVAMGGYNGNTGAFDHIEFNSLAHCQAAAKAVRTKEPEVVTICAEKGTKFAPVAK